MIGTRLRYDSMRIRTAITVGSFDGAHIGHAELLRRARQAVGPSTSGGRVVAISFYPHPLSTLRRESAPPRITCWEQRQAALLALGADEVIRLDPTPELLSLDPHSFVQRMVSEHHPVVWVEGPDFRFGKGRVGDVQTLRQLERKFNFETIVVPVREVELNDLTVAPASSTLARWLIANGRIADIRRVLDRDLETIGVVVPGDHRGRSLGFATTNIRSESMAPADGVYAGVAFLPDNRAFAAAISVGSKPTFGNRPCALEAHLIGWDGTCDGAILEYDWPIRLRFLAWLREQIRYDDAAPLIRQIELDVHDTLEVISRRGFQVECPAAAESTL